jgi:hypothetical protein
LIEALQDNFQQSKDGNDEKSRAYSAVLNGVDNTYGSQNTQSYVALRLLLIRFLDICKALDQEGADEVFVPKQPGPLALSIYNVCFMSHRL